MLDSTDMGSEGRADQQQDRRRPGRRGGGTGRVPSVLASAGRPSAPTAPHLGVVDIALGDQFTGEPAAFPDPEEHRPARPAATILELAALSLQVLRAGGTDQQKNLRA